MTHWGVSCWELPCDPSCMCSIMCSLQEELQSNAVGMEVQRRELEECRQACLALRDKMAASDAVVCEEQDRCRLLMDYPSLHHLCDTAGLGSTEARRHMCANTVRIMLLEEQNSLLRTRMVTATEGERPRSVGRSPSQLWQPELLHAAPQLACKSEPSLHTSAQDTKVEQKYKGHLGHLVEALRCASRLSEDSPATVKSRRSAWS